MGVALACLHLLSAAQAVGDSDGRSCRHACHACDEPCTQNLVSDTRDKECPQSTERRVADCRKHGLGESGVDAGVGCVRGAEYMCSGVWLEFDLSERWSCRLRTFRGEEVGRKPRVPALHEAYIDASLRITSASNVRQGSLKGDALIPKT